MVYLHGSHLHFSHYVFLYLPLACLLFIPSLVHVKQCMCVFMWVCEHVYADHVMDVFLNLSSSICLHLFVFVCLRQVL